MSVYDSVQPHLFVQSSSNLTGDPPAIPCSGWLLPSTSTTLREGYRPCSFRRRRVFLFVRNATSGVFSGEGLTPLPLTCPDSLTLPSCGEEVRGNRQFWGLVVVAPDKPRLQGPNPTGPHLTKAVKWVGGSARPAPRPSPASLAAWPGAA